MANNISYADKFQKALDKVMTEQLTSGWMEGNASLVKYDGGKTIKIPKMDMTGLGDYSRADGYPEGSLTFSYESHTFSMDRGCIVPIDSMDVNETEFVTTASVVLGEFQRTKVAPEIDAYRYSKIYSLASSAGKVNAGYAADVSTIYKTLLNDIAIVQDEIGGDTELVITMNRRVGAVLANSSEMTRYISMIDFNRGSISSKVKSIDNIPIIEASSSRMKTEYTFYDGKSTGETAGGFVPAAGAVNINWIITPKKAPIGVVKTYKPVIINPDVNQSRDAYIVKFRKYHDLWIPDNKLAGVYVNIDTDANLPSA